MKNVKRTAQAKFDESVAAPAASPMDAVLQGMARSGVLEVAGTRDGKPVYRLRRVVDPST